MNMILYIQLMDVLGFDYLIDNLADSAEGKFLPQLNYGIIDEVD